MAPRRCLRGQGCLWASEPRASCGQAAGFRATWKQAALNPETGVSAGETLRYLPSWGRGSRVGSGNSPGTIPREQPACLRVRLKEGSEMWHHFLLGALGTGDSLGEQGRPCAPEGTAVSLECPEPVSLRVPQVVRPHGLSPAPGRRGQGCWKMERLDLVEMFQEPLGSLVSWTRNSFPPLEWRPHPCAPHLPCISPHISSTSVPRLSCVGPASAPCLPRVSPMSAPRWPRVCPASSPCQPHVSPTSVPHQLRVGPASAPPQVNPLSSAPSQAEGATGRSCGARGLPPLPPSLPTDLPCGLQDKLRGGRGWESGLDSAQATPAAESDGDGVWPTRLGMSASSFSF